MMTRDNSEEKKEESAVQEARQGLLKVLMQHKLKSKFSSTPLDLDASENSLPFKKVERSILSPSSVNEGNTLALTDGDLALISKEGSITPSEKEYLERLLQSDDVVTMEAAAAKLQDPSLFPCEEEVAQAGTLPPSSPNKTSDTATMTKEETEDCSTNKEPIKRRDSHVQQKLMEIHQQTSVKPSKVLQRMSLIHRNSILENSDGEIGMDGTGNSRMDNTANSRQSRYGNRLPPHTQNSSVSQDSRNEILSDVAVGPGAQSRAPNYQHGESWRMDDEDNILENSLEDVAEDHVAEDDEKDPAVNDTGTGMLATEFSHFDLSDIDPFKDISSWLDGAQGVEVDDSGVPLIGPASSSSDGTITNLTTGNTLTTISPGNPAADLIGPSLHANRPFRILGTSAHDVSCHPHVLSPPLMESLLSFVPEGLMDHNYWLKYSLVRDGPRLLSLLRQVRASNDTILAIETTDGHVFGSFTSNAWRLSQGWYGSNNAFLWRMRRSRLDITRSVLEQAVQESEIQVFPVRPGSVAVQYCSKECLMLGRGEIVLGSSGVSSVHSANTTTPPRRSNSSASGSPPSGKKVATATPAAAAAAAATAAANSQLQGRHYGHGIYLDASLTRGSTSSSETFGNPCLMDANQRGARFEISNLELWTLTSHDNTTQAQQTEFSTLFLEGGGRTEKDLNVLGILVGGPI